MADLFIVVVKTDAVRKHEMFESNLVAFVIEKDFGGVTVEKCSTYNDEIDIANVTFRNTCVPSGQYSFKYIITNTFNYSNYSIGII